MFCTLTATDKEVSDFWFDMVCGQVFNVEQNPQGLLLDFYKWFSFELVV